MSWNIKKQVPESRMSFVAQIVKEVKKGRAIARNQPGLQLVSPHFVTRCDKAEQGSKQECKTNGKQV